MTLAFWGAVGTTLISLAAGTGLYAPVSAMLGIDPVYHVAVAVVLALCAENLLKAILDFSGKPQALNKLTAFLVTRDPDVLKDDKKDRGGDV